MTNVMNHITWDEQGNRDHSVTLEDSVEVPVMDISYELGILAQSDLSYPYVVIQAAWDKMEGWGRAARRDKLPKLSINRETFEIALKFAIEDMNR